jgi:hypothetical protein
MAGSWWSLGEGSGYRGEKLEVYRITCPFCEEKGNFSVSFTAQKRKPNSKKQLNFDTLKCENCAGYVMVLWSAREYDAMNPMHDYRVLPWPRKLTEHPKHWPEDIGRHWLQAHRSLNEDNFDAAAVMARSALQLAVRGAGATGGSLKSEIENLVKTGTLPPLIGDWSHEVRELGNESAHPKPGDPPTDKEDAGDIVNFLDFLLEYLLDLPHRIEQYRKRRSAAP